MARSPLARIRKRGLIPITWGEAEVGKDADARRVFGKVAEMIETGEQVSAEDKARLIAFFDSLADGLELRAMKKRGAKKKGSAARARALDEIRKANPKTKRELFDLMDKIARRAGVTRETIAADIETQLEAEDGRPQWPAPVVPRLTYDELREKYPDMGHEFWAWASKLD